MCVQQPPPWQDDRTQIVKCLHLRPVLLQLERTHGLIIATTSGSRASINQNRVHRNYSTTSPGDASRVLRYDKRAKSKHGGTMLNLSSSKQCSPHKWHDEESQVNHQSQCSGDNTPCSQRMPRQAGYAISQLRQEQSKYINTFFWWWNSTFEHKVSKCLLTFLICVVKNDTKPRPSVLLVWTNPPRVLPWPHVKYVQLQFWMKMLYGQLLGWSNSYPLHVPQGIGVIVSPLRQ
jgi:hypothetical protein